MASAGGWAGGCAATVGAAVTLLALVPVVAGAVLLPLEPIPTPMKSATTPVRMIHGHIFRCFCTGGGAYGCG